MNAFNDVEKVASLLGSDGPLSKYLPHYEVRESQQEMLKSVFEAYLENKTTLIEAGTGTGKSLAYLIPALIWALENHEISVISTHTIALQEQLLNKDIPLILKGLNLSAKVVIAKGMNNYICLRKLNDCHHEKHLFSEREKKEIEKIEEIATQTPCGSKSSLSFVPLPETWEQIGAEAENCTHAKCSHFKECFFYKARKEAADAHLIIANHHLLFADLALRSEDNNYDKPCILPAYKRLIIDEAHHIEDVATSHFAEKTSRIALLKLLLRLHSEKGGKLKAIEARIEELKIKDGLEIAINFEEAYLKKREVLDTIDQIFYLIGTFFSNAAPEEEKLRFRQHHLNHPLWLGAIQPAIKRLCDCVTAWNVLVSSITIKIKNHDKLLEACQNLLIEVDSLTERIQGQITALHDFAFQPEKASTVRWIEGRSPNFNLITAELAIAPILSDSLFSKIPSIILTSATLTTHRQFSFLRKTLGIKKASEKIFDSPFDYESQALFTIPSDLPHPDHPQFIQLVCDRIYDLMLTTKGNAFILFTSYQMLKTCYDWLQERLKKSFYLLCQGEDSRHQLLERFKQKKGSILFGTDSFWEGVDVVGEALKCVIIVKLPFKVPNDPIFQARCELINQEGGSAFFDYSLPHAVVKFKQGFGRLIRSKKDHGCIVCFDQRLISKGYGKIFLKSLPNCTKIFEPSTIIKKKVHEFLQKKASQIKQFQ